jgi:hypothetical protein
MELEDKYVGWCRYKGNGDQKAFVTCNSDDPGAFKVFRESVIEEAYNEGRSHQAKLELQARDRFLADLKARQKKEATSA